MKAEKRVRHKWLFWKPIACGVLTYTEASECDIETLLEANVIAGMKFTP